VDCGVASGECVEGFHGHAAAVDEEFEVLAVDRPLPRQVRLDEDPSEFGPFGPPLS
jgi:hypothetical protein